MPALFQWPALASMDEDVPNHNQISIAVLFALYRQTQQLHSQLQEVQTLGKGLGYNSTWLDIQCAICDDQYDDPHVLSCGHCFCRSCIRHWLRVKAQCPLCRECIDSEPVPTLAHSRMSSLSRSLASLEVSPAAESLLSLLDQVFATVHDFDDLPEQVNLAVLAQPSVQSFFQISQGPLGSTFFSNQWLETEDSRYTPPAVCRQCSAIIPEIKCSDCHAAEPTPLFLQDCYLGQPGSISDQRRSMAPSPDASPKDADELPHDLFAEFDRSMQVGTMERVGTMRRVASLLKLGLPLSHPLIANARVLSDEYLRTADAASQQPSYSGYSASGQNHPEEDPRVARDENETEAGHAALQSTFDACYSLNWDIDSVWDGFSQNDSEGSSSVVDRECFDWEEEDDSC
ncbi:peroxisome biogenesis factor 10 [Dimargaris verticillata]|uniref:Peroxisome biogenesis factor 10 n=1 Tax=Dimargaris verticillata TaxID=2761393 RepID=A0A9W8E7Y3_9FUNG|nr:peroxisome biogenesis factor 10 [Dimargaris verticillata]